jgi:hypothetical protein
VHESFRLDTLLISLPACERRPTGDPIASVLGISNLEQMRAAESISATLIDGTVTDKSGDAVASTSEQYPVTKTPGPVRQDHLRVLLDTLVNPESYVWGAAKSCIFTPGEKLSFSIPDHDMELLFCFDCDIQIVYYDKKPVSSGNFDHAREDIVHWFQVSFPESTIIQNLSQ